MRIACLSVPDFPLAALLRAEPELAGRPVAVAERRDPASPLVAVSPAARAAGIRPGLSTAQGRTIVGDLEVRVESAERSAAALEALADVAASFSPRVETRAEGLVWLDADGLETLCGDETHLATVLAARCRRVGLPGTEVGIGSSREVARLAARGGLGVVPPGAEAELLAPLPVALLEPSAALAATLARWGITTLAELAGLPSDAVAARLGENALRLVRLARGEDDAPLVPRHRALRFEESVDCEWPIDTFEPLSFLLRAALERLTSRLDLRGYRAGDLDLALALANRAREPRRVRIAAPTNDVKSLLALVRVSFEARPPAAPIDGLRISAVAEHLRAIELDLFRPPGPLPEALATTLARLAAQGTLRTFEAFAPGEGKVAQVRNVPLEVLALRAFRPAVAIEVVCDRGRPDFVRSGPAAGSAIQGRVVGCAGPWRLSGEWWGEPLARDDYDLELTDGGVYRVYREHGTNRWFAAGSYD